MLNFEIRPAIETYIPSMLVLLNDIIAIGGTTALTKPLTTNELADWLQISEQGHWFIAKNGENCLGFQGITPHSKLPPEACDIATFVDPNTQGQGIGHKLFDYTRNFAEDQGYHWINATIRADNTGGLGFYSRLGFKDWHHDKGVTLHNGLTVDRVSKRYDLALGSRSVGA
jgi:GNAT superfamily N-acetyltransferase